MSIGTNSPSSPLSCSSPKLLLSPQQGPLSLQNHYSSKYHNVKQNIYISVIINPDVYL